jgi:hypothetical protein
MEGVLAVGVPFVHLPETRGGYYLVANVQVLAISGGQNQGHDDVYQIPEDGRKAG